MCKNVADENRVKKAVFSFEHKSKAAINTTTTTPHQHHNFNDAEFILVFMQFRLAQQHT